MLLNKKGKYGNKKEIVDGVKFDSRLEMYCHAELKRVGIEFIFQEKIELIPKFRYNTQNIRAITMLVDFVVLFGGKRIYVDTKGMPTEVSKIKYKMLRYHLREQENTDVVWLKNKKEVNSFISSLKEEEDEYNQQSSIAW